MFPQPIERFPFPFPFFAFNYEGPKPDNPNFRFFDTRKWDFTSRLIPFFRIPDFLLAEIQILLSLLNPVVQKWTTQIYKFLLVEDRKFQNLGFRALQNFRISTSRNSEFGLSKLAQGSGLRQPAWDFALRARDVLSAHII